jgi:hypothetical protein
MEHQPHRCAAVHALSFIIIIMLPIKPCAELVEQLAGDLALLVVLLKDVLLWPCDVKQRPKLTGRCRHGRLAACWAAAAAVHLCLLEAGRGNG